MDKLRPKSPKATHLKLHKYLLKIFTFSLIRDQLLVLPPFPLHGESASGAGSGVLFISLLTRAGVSI